MRWLILLLLPVLACAEIHFLTPSGSIQTAIDSAQVGDTLVLEEGVYTETFLPRGKDLTIASRFLLDGDTAHIQNTFIQPDLQRPDTGSVCIYGSGETLESRLIGLRFRYGSGTRIMALGEVDYAGGVILVHDSSALSVESCILELSSSCFGGGLATVGTSASFPTALQLIKTTIRDCYSSRYGGGIFARYCSLRVAHSELEFNTSDWIAAGDIVDSHVSIESTRVCDNYGQMGGLFCGWSTGIISQCSFEDNATDSTYLHSAAHLELIRFYGTLEHCVFLPNRGGHKSFYISDTHRFQCVNNLFVGNSSAIDYGTLFLERYNGDVAFNVFLDNETGYGGTLVSNRSEEALIHNNVFRGNRVVEIGNYGSAIQIQGLAPLIWENLFEGNLGAAVALTGGQPFFVENNWWGDASGPFHPTLNPQGHGDTLLQENASFVPWLTDLPDTVSSVESRRPEWSPATWRIHAVYPNPFNSNFRVSISGIVMGDFRLTLHNLLGQQVAVIHEGFPVPAEILFAAPPNLAAGIYFLHACSREHSESRKLIFLK
ncbi:MAG: hypothetical protein PHI18_05090 [bacterium]|nr:hypothetical protein [bacterium]